jgi:hypothetical protein
MRYFQLNTITRAIHQIANSSDPREHVTGRAGTALAVNCFPVHKFTITPEKILQPDRGKRLYLSIKRLINYYFFFPHCFVEFNSRVNSSIYICFCLGR